MTLLREIRRRIIDALYVLVVGVTRTQLMQARLQREMWERFMVDIAGGHAEAAERRRDSDRAVN